MCRFFLLCTTCCRAKSSAEKRHYLAPSKSQTQFKASSETRIQFHTRWDKFAAERATFLSAQMQKRMTASGPSDVTGGARGRNTPAASGCNRPRNRPLRALHAATPGSPPARNSCVRRQRVALIPVFAAPGEFYFRAHSLAKIRTSRRAVGRIFSGGRALLNHVHSQRVGGGFTPCDARASTFIPFHSEARAPSAAAAALCARAGGARGGKFATAICQFDWQQTPNARHIRRILILPLLKTRPRCRPGGAHRAIKKTLAADVMN